MNKAVVFDFDGVVINSFDVQKKAFCESYRMIVGDGHPPFDEFLRNSGGSLHCILEKMGLPVLMIPLYRKISRENISDIQIIDGIRPLLERLNMEGYRCGLCTGKDRERTEEILRIHYLNSYFSSVVCSDDVEKPKPDAESLALVIKQLEADRQNSVMIGDAANDIKCAKNAAVKSIAVTWGGISKELLITEEPDCIVSTVEVLYHSVISLINNDRRICNGVNG